MNPPSSWWRAVRWLLAAVWLVARPGFAHADEVVALRSGLLGEVAHEVDLVMDRGHARLTVRRAVFNDGQRHDQVTFFIQPPEGAVATGLRTLGKENGRPKWFEGELLEAEEAAARYRELTGIGGFYPKDPALLSWRTQGELALQVFPCPPHERKEVEYTLQVPTRYREGAHQLSLPPMGTRDLLALVTIRSAKGGDRLQVAGKRVASGHRVRAKRGEWLDIRLEPAQTDLLEGALAVQRAGTGPVVRHLDLFAAPKLSSVPRALDIVLAVDGSRSVDPELFAGSIEASRAYLSHAPHAKVLFVLFDREVRFPLGGFADAQRVSSQLEHLTIEPRNGSDVEKALAEADGALAARPVGRSRRIVVFTDGLVHSRLTAARMRAATLASHALTHIALVTDKGVKLTRADHHPWDRATRPLGGLVWYAQVRSHPSYRDALVHAYEELMRPVRLDQVSIDTRSTVSISAPTSLREGEGFVELALERDAIEQVEVRGRLWNRLVRRVVRRSEAESRRWSALLFGSSEFEQLEEADMMSLALHGGAVSPVTSYLAIEPGVRPSTEGIEHTEVGWGRVRTGAPRLRSAQTSVAGGPFDHHEWLRSKLSQSWRDCGGSGTALVSFETTKAEIVRVDDATGLGDGERLADRCLRQAVWDLELPGPFERENDGWQLFVDA